MVPAAKQRVALATLLLHANRYVSNDQLIEYLWDGRSPNDARAALRTHIARLRQVLDDGRDGDRLIHTREHGYLLRADGADIDVALFRGLVRRADQAGEADAQEAPLREALALWRGPALADMPSQALHQDHAGRLDEERLRALERSLELALLSGRHEQVVPELKSVTTAHPLRERLWAHLMLALYRSGRQAEALRAYGTVAGLLREELGIDPGADLRQLHQSILVADPGLLLPATEPSAASVTRRGDAGDVPPSQLPSDTVAFTGRADHLRVLDALREPVGGGSPRPVRIAAITGTAGVGKSALAVHWAHHVQQHFPDGQLYVNLRGFGPDEPMDPATALEQLLQGLSVPAQRIPADLDARSALFRSVLSDRRVLLLLDNARTVAQVLPLLPGSACVVLVTSRDRLRGLSVHGDTRHVDLNVFAPEESAALLTSLLGAGRTRAEPHATAELGQLCAHLPLALRIAVANLTIDGYRSVSEYVDDLRGDDRLGALQIDGDQQSAIRGTLDLSYAALPPRTRAVFRLLGLVPGPDFTPEAAAALTGSPLPATRQELTRLTTAHLIDQYAPGRYRFHDLLRLYATERVHAQESPESVREARQRLYDWYLLSVRAATDLVEPYWSMLPVPQGLTAVTPAAFEDVTSARTWLAVEHANLVAAIHQAVSTGPRQSVWLLGDAMRCHFWTGRRMNDWLSCAQAAVAVAEEEGDAAATAAALRGLADAYSHQEQHHAIALYARALSFADQAGWFHGKSGILSNRANTYWRLGRLADAAESLEEAMRLDRQLGRAGALSSKHNNLAAVYTQLGRLESALGHLTVALEFGPSGFVECNLGEVRLLQGHFDQALRHLTSARSILRESGNHAVEPYCLVLLSDLHCDLGRYDEAVALGEQALARSRDVEDQHAESLALNALGRAYARTGRRALAEHQHRRAVDLAGDDNLFPETAGLIGLAAVVTEHAQAVPLAERALRIARERSFRLLEGLAMTALADLALRAGDPAEAAGRAESALNVHRETGHRLGEARTLRLLGEAVSALHGGEAAGPHRRAAATLFAELGVTEPT
ncbi:BTAD domain-containing putative transcriptional regulator [Nonomuraea antimicrobica]|uniref:BTAD domain-containing putative transcriptional regulator n=1 Tax=Nonomuraea antimicrobica TaxID=561173 RepID=A0ABP7BX74_9ACTN